MFDFINTIKEFWSPGSETGGKLPLLEKEQGESVPYSSTMRKIKVDGDIDIAYIDEGKKDADVLLFIHGMGGAIPSWRRNISFLKQYYRCIAIDLPGHGHSSKDEYPYTMTFYTGTVLSFIKKLRLSNVTLVGHSMGGQIAAVAALEQQDVIAKLIFVSPAGFEPYTAAEKQMLISMHFCATASAQAFSINKYNYLKGFCNDHKAAADLLKRLPIFREDSYIFGKMMFRSVESMLLESVNGRLDKIKVPCLVLLGKHDKVSPYPYLKHEEYFEVVKQEARQLQNGLTLVFDPGCHFIQYQRPKTFNTILRKFLLEKETNDVGDN